jgi:Domain of unknown function (DUF4124)
VTTDTRSSVEIRRFRCDRITVVGACCGLIGSLALVAFGAAAQGIYTCTDSHGKRITSDRPIAECLDREQRVLNKDGSERQRVGPSLTAEERARQDEQQRKRLAEDSARRDAARNDRNLLGRYPNRAAHDRARNSAQEPYAKALEASTRRLATLAEDRRKLEVESEFYKGKALPPKLKQQFELNEASASAQKEVVHSHEEELKRIRALYDEELARLKLLWGGAAPGSLGPMSPGSGASAR